MTKLEPTLLKKDGELPAFRKSTKEAKGSLHGKGVRIAVSLSQLQFAILKAKAVAGKRSISSVISECISAGLK